MHEAVARVCAATVTAVDLVASGKVQRAVNLSGGLHHALFDKASGFCVYNDLVLGIEHAIRRYGLRVAYVDLDAHHGDGVQWLLYDRAEVLSVSLHESGRYLFPGTGHTYETGRDAGRGLSVNVPLEPFTEDDSFLEAFEAVVPASLEMFKPDLIVLQAGADMHRYDPLADLSLSTRAFERSYARMSELADEFCEGRLVATGGGGYDPYRTVPRVVGAPLGGGEPPGGAGEDTRKLAGALGGEESRRITDETSRRRLAAHPPPRRHRLAQSGGGQEAARHARAPLARITPRLLSDAFYKCRGFGSRRR